MSALESASMDDILASIRSIIVEEDETSRAGRPASVRDVLNDKTQAEDTSNLLELARMAREKPSEGIRSGDGHASVDTSGSSPTLDAMLVRNYDGAENTLEGVVREMLRPMLAEWLDENLPDLVERLVAQELKRAPRD
ncbi:MAG: DUF2497 domain-containing protein [Pacificimonas sp.]